MKSSVAVAGLLASAVAVVAGKGPTVTTCPGEIVTTTTTTTITPTVTTTVYTGTPSTSYVFLPNTSAEPQAVRRSSSSRHQKRNAGGSSQREGPGPGGPGGPGGPRGPGGPGGKPGGGPDGPGGPGGPGKPPPRPSTCNSVTTQTITQATTASTTHTITTTLSAPTTTRTTYPCANPVNNQGPTYGDANQAVTNNLGLSNTRYELDTPEGADPQSCCNACFFELSNCVQAYWYSYQGCVVSQATVTGPQVASGRGITGQCPQGTFRNLTYGPDTAPAFRSTGNIAGPCGEVYTNF